MPLLFTMRFRGILFQTTVNVKIYINSQFTLNCKSTVIVSQLPVKSWYDLFADNTYADACLDRMIHKAFRLELNGKNMRKPV